MLPWEPITEQPHRFYSLVQRCNQALSGASPNLAANATVSDQVPMQHDFRQSYAAVMQDWLCLTPAESQTVLGSSFTRLPVFGSAVLPLDGSVSLTGQYYQGQSRLNCKVTQNQKYRGYALSSRRKVTAFRRLAQEAIPLRLCRKPIRIHIQHLQTKCIIA